MTWNNTPDFYNELHVFRFESKLEVHEVRILEDGLGPEVALVEDLFDLKERIHALVEATGTLIEIFSVVVEGQTGMHEVLAFEANLPVFCHGLTDAVQYLRLLPDVLYDRVGPFRGHVLLDSEPFLSGHLHFGNLIILTMYKSRYAFSYRNSQNNINNIYILHIMWL